MITRAFDSGDVEKAREIHARFFANEFTFPDFLKGFYCSFVVEDDKGIVSAGGVRPICESIIITDKDRSVKDRKYALAQVLQASMFICDSYKFNELTAFIQDAEWERHLSKVGFVPTKGKSLVLGW